MRGKRRNSPELPDASAGTPEERRERARQDFTFFRRAYFPHYCLVGGDSRLHEWLDTELPRMADAPEGVRLAIAAPRGEAKSTFVSLFFVLWAVLTGRKHYILIIADALEQAASLLGAVKDELEFNEALKRDFPGAGKGHVWNVGTVVTPGNVKIQALGAGKRMRGLRHGPHRPDLIVLDDLENDGNVDKPEQRDKLQSWLQKTVLNLGAADGSMDVVYVGTLLHYDSVLARTLRKPLWKARTFRSILRWPDRMDLWDEWESLLSSRGEAEARRFYRQHRVKMEAGAEVSWPASRPLYRLMCLRAEDREAFDSEQQNDPLSANEAPFNGCITFWVDRSRDWLLFGAVDPSLGKQGAGRDPSAILVGGFLRGSMTLDVVEASIRKRHPDRIIEDVIALHDVHHPLLWGVEAVQFQEFFAHVLVQRAAERGIALPVRPLVNSADKLLRIESLQPHMAQGRIRLHASQQALIDQLRHFPRADHDDGPDALEMLWRLASTGFVSMGDAYIRMPLERGWGDDGYDRQDRRRNPAQSLGIPPLRATGTRHHAAEIGSSGRRPATGRPDRGRTDQCPDFLLGPHVGATARRGCESAVAPGNALQRTHGCKPLNGRLPDLLPAVRRGRLHARSQGLHRLYPTQPEITPDVDNKKCRDFSRGASFLQSYRINK